VAKRQAPKQVTPPKSEPSQVDLFRAKARELGADTAEGEDDVMRRLASQKRHAEPSKKKPSR